VLLALVATFCCSAGAGAQSAQPQPVDQVEEIVVTAVRSGVPVWRVSGPGSTIVLVGSLKDVSKQTRWNSTSLVEALRKSDRVMFPAAVQYTGSLFSVASWAAKAKKMGTLPKGQSLGQFVPEAQYRRLIALHRKGLLEADYDRKHPLSVAYELIEAAKGKPRGRSFISIEPVRPGFGDVDTYVRAAVKKYKLNLVPLPKAKLKPVMQDFLGASPQEDVPCLLAAIALAEAGRPAVEARSEDWARRRVPEMLASPAHEAFEICLPRPMRPTASPEVRGTVRSLLNDTRVTVAVLQLSELAAPGGILDALKAAGFDVSGPQWRR
jgi:hypothetical protein